MNNVDISKLKWHSRRSVLELDLFFSRFLEKQELSTLNAQELFAYQQLLEYEDNELIEIFVNNKSTNDDTINNLVKRIRYNF
jgi:succinate dehydrogenase flavin-adding protein (antitoxin of CptAB toxin-antitoxin module)